MRYKLTLALGFAVGYTLGAKAGRKRYDQIMRLVHAAAESPAVQEAAGVLQAQASGVFDSAKGFVGGKVSERLGHHDDLPTGASFNGHGQ